MNQQIETALVKGAWRLAGQRIKHRMFERIAAQYAYGQRLQDCVRTIARRGRKRKPGGDLMTLVAERIAARLRAGESFANAVKPWVGTRDVLILRASEAGNALDHGMRTVVQLDRMRSELVRTTVGGLTQPAVLSMVVYALLYYMGHKVLGAILGAAHGSPSGLAAMLPVLARATHSSLFIVVPIVAMLAVVVVAVSLPRFDFRGRRWLDTHVFPWTFYRRIIGALWLSGYAGLLASGVKDTEALKEMTGYATGWLRARLSAALRHMMDGKNIGEALEATGAAFPDPDTIEDLVIYADYPDAEEKMAAIADNALQEASQHAMRLSKLLSAVMNALVYLLILLIVGGLTTLMMSVGRAAGGV